MDTSKPGAVILPFPATRPGLSPAASRFASAATATSTEKAYQGDWNAWTGWLSRTSGKRHGEATDQDLANYLGSMGERGNAIATIRRRRAAIETIRRHLRLPRLSGSDTNAVVAGSARELGDYPRRARPLTAILLRRVLGGIGTRRLVDLRDRALLLICWQAALRCSEVVSLDWRDYAEAAPLGGTLVVRKSKGARDGRPVSLPVTTEVVAEYCPVAAMAAWRRKSPSRAPGVPIFLAAHRDLKGAIGIVSGRRLGSRGVGRMMVRRMEAAGLDAEGFSSHSLRAGMLTEAAAAGVSPWRLKDHSRHKRSETLDLYVREIEALHSHPGKGLLSS